MSQFDAVKQKLVVNDSHAKNIPVCHSPQQFFTIKPVRKRKGPICLIQSLQIKPTQAKQLHQHRRQDSEGPLSRKPSSEAYTDATISKTGISFKKGCPKRKINFLSSQKKGPHSSESLSNPNYLSGDETSSKMQNAGKYSPTKTFNNISIANFRIVKDMGMGLNSQLFAALQVKTGCLCTLQKISKQALQNKQMFEKMWRQVLIHSNNQHPNIISLYGCFDDRDYVYLVYQYCCEADLSSLVGSKRRECDQEEILYECFSIMKQVCEGVKFLHSRSIVHGDIQPQSILLSFGSVPKLRTFAQTLPHSNNRTFTIQDDLYALGILAYRLLKGTPTSKHGNNITPSQIDLSQLEDEASIDFIQQLLEIQENPTLTISQVLLHPFLSLHEEHYL